MAENSSIEWTDHTFNPWEGCRKASTGCKNCYAETRAKRFGTDFGGTRIARSELYWKQPLKWNRDAWARQARASVDGTPDPARPKVFCASLADVFEHRPLTEWVPICDGYRVSFRGEIETQWRPGGYRGDWKAMKTKIARDGYEVVQLRKHPTLGSKTLKVHRLMLQAFIGECPERHITRHLDGQRSNNVLWNLAYSTQADNLGDRARHGTESIRERNGRSKLTESQVAEIRERLVSGEAQTAIAEKFGVKQTAISRIKMGQSWSESSGGETKASLPIRSCVPGQMIDSKGNPLFLEGGSFQPEPTGHCKDWKPVTMDDVRLRLFKLIDATPNLDWLLLTKRPENIYRMWPETFPMSGGFTGEHRCQRKNVWLGTSVENQEYADKRIPELLRCRDLSPVLFLSMEPLLGPVDLRKAHMTSEPLPHWPSPTRVDWVIAGGESGPGARPMHPNWIRSLQEQCETASVPFFFKQWGEFSPVSDRQPGDLIHYESLDCNPETMRKVGKKQAGRTIDGQVYDAFPVVK